MADKIMIKHGELGDRTEMPNLRYNEDEGCELGYRADEQALYVGTKNGNVRLCGVNDLKLIQELQEAVKAINARLEGMQNA